MNKTPHYGMCDKLKELINRSASSATEKDVILV